jgi:ribosomal protein S18 acetylase RimI-like enzyme
MDETIRGLEDGDKASVAHLLDDAVGAGFWDFCDGEGDLSAVALTGGRVAGVVIAQLEPLTTQDAGTVFGPLGSVADSASGEAAEDARGGTATARPGRPVLHVRAVAVAPAARRRGLGWRLLTHVEATAAAGGVAAAYLFAWLPAGRPEPGAVHLYAAAGYEAGRDLPDFYAAGSLAAGAECPYCGPPPCRCAARPYVKRLGSAPGAG